MTNVVVWKPKARDVVWLVADTRVSIDRRSASRLTVTDQAQKLFPLRISSGWPRFLLPGSPELSLNMVLGFSGSVSYATLTHAAVATMFDFVECDASAPVTLPTLDRIAGVIAFVSERYIRDGAMTYAFGERAAVCEFILVGEDFRGPAATSSVGVRLIRPSVVAGHLRQVVTTVDVHAGEKGIIGDDPVGLLRRIQQLESASNLRIQDWEPKVAVAERIDRATHSAVGGTMQAAVLEGNSVRIFGAMKKPDGADTQNFLGFELEHEIAPILGMIPRIASIL